MKHYIKTQILVLYNVTLQNNIKFSVFTFVILLCEYVLFFSLPCWPWCTGWILQAANLCALYDCECIQGNYTFKTPGSSCMMKRKFWLAAITSVSQEWLCCMQLLAFFIRNPWLLYTVIIIIILIFILFDKSNHTYISRGCEIGHIARHSTTKIRYNIVFFKYQVIQNQH